MSNAVDINIMEVGPRDGLQNEKQQVATEIKIEFIQLLIAAGLTNIEVTSFVSPKWVPQMADHNEVATFAAKVENVNFPVLVPNKRGFENALACNVKHIAVFTAASETFCQKNINCSISDSISRFQEIISLANSKDIKVRGYVSCIAGCPYEGNIAPAKVAQVATELYKAGCYEISLGDTIGVGTPNQILSIIKHVSETIPLSNIALHCHDTYGQAIANIYAAVTAGITTIDSSAAGLGGCPYAKGASGNVATEDVVYLLNGLGLRTNIDLYKLIKAGKYICQHMQRQNNSKVAQAKQ